MSQVTWTVAGVIWRGFVTLGGVAFIKQIVDWMGRRPKLVGDLETISMGNMTLADGTKGAALMIAVYLVNARTERRTVRGWELDVSKDGQKWKAEQALIPNDFKWDAMNVDWQKATRLYDYAAQNLLEYRKGVRGWVLFIIRNVSSTTFNDKALLELTAIDALKGRHTIKHMTGTSSLTRIPYYT